MKLKPFSTLRILSLFVVPTILFSLSFLTLLPALVQHGFSPFWVFNLVFILPLACLLIAAFVGIKLEGGLLSWAHIRDRFRLGKLTGHGWLWTLALLVFNIGAGYVATAVLVNAPDSLHLFSWPPELTAFMAKLHNLEDNFLGIPVAGNWWLVAYYAIVLFVFNILGEELWWRGFILPRQELTQGRCAWFIHGILWCLFHVFYFQTVWTALVYLPLTLSISYVSQKVQNSWPGIITHFVVNAAILELMILKAFGPGLP